MGDFRAIADTSEALAKRIQDGLRTEPTLADMFSDIGRISDASPADLDNDGGDALLSIFLYRVNEDPHLKNQPPVAGTGGRLRRAPLTLDLHYLLTPLMADMRSRQLALGKVMQVLSDHSSLAGADLTGSLAGDPPLRIVLNPLTMAELGQVWGALGARYRLSLSYTVRVTAVDSSAERSMSRVFDRDSSFGARSEPLAVES
jgi:hypothetical protein